MNKFLLSILVLCWNEAWSQTIINSPNVKERPTLPAILFDKEIIPDGEVMQS